ncbi:DUF3987 domain-containing protein [Pandoraea pnomenusa]|uniref:DUF3987 domain-containing protein n=1 Tax=Pandoraea pnomenusa TaxID=93220 RepID=UPI00114645DC|nr:DUF3987 domain-containing protein [Pandoraea pnomenusa]QDH60978.1 DUF3987 domain-containing protein [Pandoraea pnomenusa]
MPIHVAAYGRPSYLPPPQGLNCPATAIPRIIGDAIQETVSITGVPIEVVFQTALAAVSLAVQDRVNVLVPNYEPAPVAQFLLTISDSSAGKSLGQLRYFKALTAEQLRRDEAFAEDELEFEAKSSIWRDRERQLSNEYRKAKHGSDEADEIAKQRFEHTKAKPKKPVRSELMYFDATSEQLRNALAERPSAAIVSVEGGETLNGPTYREPAAFCGYWSGEDRRVGLAGGNKLVISPRLTTSILVQAHRFGEYMNSRGAAAFETGLIARTLPAMASVPNDDGRRTETEVQPEPMLDRFNRRVAEILARGVPSLAERQTLELSHGAKICWALYKDHVNDHLIRGDYSEQVKSFFRKVGQHATRLAALFHYFDGGDGGISGDAMCSAIAVCEWYVQSFVRIFEQYAPSETQLQEKRAARLLLWLQEAVKNGVSYGRLAPGAYPERELRIHSSVRGAEAILAIDTLVAQGKIATYVGPRGGRIVSCPNWWEGSGQRGVQGGQSCFAPSQRATPFDAGLPLGPITPSQVGAAPPWQEPRDSANSVAVDGRGLIGGVSEEFARMINS